MPYISTEQIKAKREAIKKAFPSKKGWKFSVTRNDCMEIKVNILEAPIDMLTTEDSKKCGYKQVNHFYIKKHYADTPEVRDVLLKIYDIMESGNYIVSRDNDFGDWPKFYTSLYIGHADRHFKVKEVK